ncbi:c-type cytochrome [Jiella sonneratiae]|uniref:Cytochrome c family protein n=1 Tax=Jiella sonneratiae TaxID=2816856 RepID=A0ABS3JA04_9HYPH|nr:cytochrome c family protein [Jiella sonneratiae]
MDSFEANKIFGAILGTVFVVFGGSILAEGLFHSEAPEKPGYEIVAAEPSEASGGGEKAAAEDPPIATLLQKASADNGANIFKKCGACHSGEKGGPNKVGPHLWDVVMRPVASVSDFNYSAGMKEFSEGGSKKWDYDHLYHFLKNPKGYVKGTAMGFAGLPKPEDRADVIAYLHTLSDSPAPLPEAPAEGEAAAEGGDKAATETNAATTTESGANAGGEAAQAPAEAGAAPQAPPAESGEKTTEVKTPADGAKGEQPAQPAADAAASGDKAAAPQEQQAAAQPKGEAGGEAGGQAADASGGQTAPAAAGGAAAGGEAAGGDAGATEVAGDPAAGEKVFNKCKACHSIGEGAKNKIGPELNGILGEKIAAVDGYSFSSALQTYAKDHPTWTVEELHSWLSDPKAVAPGTKMSFPGLKDQKDIDNVIAYLASFDESGKKKGE